MNPAWRKEYYEKNRDRINDLKRASEAKRRRRQGIPERPKGRQKTYREVYLERKLTMLRNIMGNQ